jgi:hypothetical protein
LIFSYLNYKEILNFFTEKQQFVLDMLTGVFSELTCYFHMKPNLACHGSLTTTSNLISTIEERYKNVSYILLTHSFEGGKKLQKL